MRKSLLEQLPDIMREGRRVAEKILESIESKHRVGLQTREIVMPNKDVAQATLFGRNNSHSQPANYTQTRLGTIASSTAITYSL